MIKMLLLFCFAFILVQSLHIDVKAKTKVDDKDIYDPERVCS